MYYCDETDDIHVNVSTANDSADVATAGDEYHDSDAANFNVYANDEDTMHVGTASLLPPATGPPCCLDPCPLPHLHFVCLHPLMPLLSAFCQHSSVSAYGEGLFANGLSLRELASCPSVSGEGLNLYAYHAKMSEVIH
jgi:hypothetical protein